MVPRVVGQTESARQQKRPSARNRRKVTKQEFLDACPEDARAFFNRLLSEAEQRGFTISWTTVGVSIRVPLASSQTLCSFYGLPSGWGSSDISVLQIYLGDRLEPRDREHLAEALQKHIPFYWKAKQTLEIQLDGEGLRKADAGLFQALDTAAQAAKRKDSGTW